MCRIKIKPIIKQNLSSFSPSPIYPPPPSSNNHKSNSHIVLARNIVIVLGIVLFICVLLHFVLRYFMNKKRSSRSLQQSSRFLQTLLQQLSVPTIRNDVADSVKWKDSDGKFVTFSVKEAWKCLNPDKPTVRWWKGVWFSQCNPRNAFILWMAVNGKLLTQDRMQKWSKENLLCPLCKKINDSHQHLFFQCDYSSKVWSFMKGKMKCGDIPNRWDLIVTMMGTMRCSNSIWSVLNRLIIAATVNCIWKERNDRLFRGQSQSVEGTNKTICEHIRVQLLSLNVKKTMNTEMVAELWNVKLKYVK